MRDYGGDDFDDDDLNVACTEDEADEPPPTGKTQTYPFCFFPSKIQRFAWGGPRTS